SLGRRAHVFASLLGRCCRQDAAVADRRRDPERGLARPPASRSSLDLEHVLDRRDRPSLRPGLRRPDRSTAGLIGHWTAPEIAKARSTSPTQRTMLVPGARSPTRGTSAMANWLSAR